jgi:hypothetical protein
MALEAIVTGIELMELCPVPALQAIANTLISIWEAVKLVGVRVWPLIYSFIIFIIFFFSPDEPPCYSSCNSNVHNHLECRS